MDPTAPTVTVIDHPATATATVAQLADAVAERLRAGTGVAA